MNIRLLDDLHLEFDLEGDFDFSLPVIEGESEMVLVLAGDITASMDDESRVEFGWSRHTNMIREWARRHRAVVMVAGNHEYYFGTFEDVREWWTNLDHNVDNFHFLDNKSVVVDGTRFIGGTLWTSLRNNNPMVILKATESMNDFKAIKMRDGDGRRCLTATDWYHEHCLTWDYIQDRVQEPFDGPTVVVTHHAPSFESIDPKFLNSQLNDAYATELSTFILYNEIDLWLHGHIHASSDYMIGDTRVVCNPRGYNSAAPMLNPNFDPRLVLTV